MDQHFIKTIGNSAIEAGKMVKVLPNGQLAFRIQKHVCGQSSMVITLGPCGSITDIRLLSIQSQAATRKK